ncbi:putative RO-10 protein, required for nuclear distribution [Fusarium austroafricanum]|uniref:Putative RO-10 protein, required for nuclear distribution n=1 Tax=Fusarium austroafricanum TaxID=2364996 RepID=A0A8H4KAX5_9HYPO|nr:putative RO-10 protein, required for nuclear distribution [Fusarium austroafricanum]
MATNMDETTLSTLDLLESRLLRIEHVLYGQNQSPALTQDRSAASQLSKLERRFSMLLSDVRVYHELMKIYRAHPDFFHAPDPSEPPSQLDIDALQSIVLASASAFPATLSSLTAIKDSPIPDPADSAALVALQDRMKAIEATQIAQAAEIADLRQRSETAVRSWYETGVLDNSKTMANLESRVSVVERQVRRAERELEAEEDL